MKQLLASAIIILLFVSCGTRQEEDIYRGPKQIGDWGTVELSSIKFHSLEMGDTIYVYTANIVPSSQGAFQNHKWDSIAGAINGQQITGDYEMVVDSRDLLANLKKHGLKVRGKDYVIERIAIKHTPNLERTIISIAVAVILAAILITIIILVIKNRQLRKAGRALYARNMAALAAADEERKQRLHYEGQIAAFKEMILSGVAGEAVKQKYQGSKLADDEKELLRNRIMNIFEQTDEIFAEDFNMQKLASLVNSNYKNVSQVINEVMGKNFSALLNEYRIQEACRRLNDVAHYGHHTIEAIGTDLGYGSRSTFVTQFKAITGLAPSEFQNLARKQSKG